MHGARVEVDIGESEIYADTFGLVKDLSYFFFFQAEDGIRDSSVTGVQTCALPISGAPQRRAFTYVDGDGERTITVLGPKLVPSGDDASLPWEELARCDAVYFVSGDVAALRAARRSRVLVATSRELATLRRAAEEIDVLVGSGADAV